MKWKKFSGIVAMFDLSFVIKQGGILLIVLALALQFTSCKSISVPSNYKTRISTLETEGFGGWAVIKAKDESIHRGELIALQNDTLWLLQDTLLRNMAVSDLKNIVVVIYRSSNAYQIVTPLGLLSSVSHGLLAIFTAPIWVILNIAVYNDALYNGMIYYPRSHSLETVRKFSRFPQGIPPGLNTDKLRPRPDKK